MWIVDALGSISKTGEDPPRNTRRPGIVGLDMIGHIDPHLYVRLPREGTFSL